MTTIIVASNPASGANTGVARTLNQAATAGNSLIAWLHHTAASTNTMDGCDDNVPNAFTQDYTAVDSLFTEGIRVYRRTNIGNAATSFTPKATAGATGAYGGMLEVTGMDNTSPYVGTTYIAEASTLSHSITFTTTTPNAIVMIGIRNGTDFGTISALTAGWSNAGLGRNAADMLYTADAGAPGSKTVTFTSSTAGGGAHYYVVEYKAAVTDPTVSTVSSPTATEGSPLAFLITLSGATTRDTNYVFTLTGTATGSDYTSTITTAMCDNSVTVSGASGSGGTFTVPTSVTSFTVTVPTTSDTIDEADETVILNLPGSVSGTGTITDDDAAPSISITPSSITVDGGDSVVLTCTLGAVSGRVTQARLVLTDGTKVGGVDYTNVITNGMFTTVSGSGSVTISGGVLSIPSSVLIFTITIPTAA